MLTAESAVFAKLKLFRFGSFILCRCVVSLLALGTGERDDISHCSILYVSYGYA
jgi:hypothetical protein